MDFQYECTQKHTFLHISTFIWSLLSLNFFVGLPVTPIKRGTHGNVQYSKMLSVSYMLGVMKQLGVKGHS